MKVPAIVRGSRVPANGADKVPAKEGCSGTLQVDPTRGKREEEGWPINREVRTQRTETGSQFVARRAYRSCNSGESAIIESRVTRASTSPIVLNWGPWVDRGKRVPNRAKSQSEARYEVRGNVTNCDYARQILHG